MNYIPLKKKIIRQITICWFVFKKTLIEKQTVFATNMQMRHVNVINWIILEKNASEMCWYQFLILHQHIWNTFGV